MHRAVIDAIATYFPENILGNDELAERLNTWTAEEIEDKTGIKERRIASPEECSSDLAVKAGEKLIADGRLDPSEVDYVLFCTQSPDYFLPTTACLIQDRLGLSRKCAALDFNLGCSGYVVGLSLAKGLIVSGQARCVLLLTGETYSKYIHPRDRSVVTLFGDGATATVVRAEETDQGIGEFVFGTDGRGGKNLIVPTGAMRKPRTPETAEEVTDVHGNVRSEDHLFMDGRQVFRFALQTVPKTVKKLLDKAGWELDDLDWLVLHQANRFMLDALVKRVGLPPEKVPYEFSDLGNTVSSTIPIVLERLLARDAIKSGDKLMLVGFGVGYSWAANVIEWH